MWQQFFEPVDEIYDKAREKWPLLPFYYYWPDKYGPLATPEVSRRYRSWFQFSQSPLGTPHVLSPAILQPDFRFFNPLNTLLRYDNSPMTEMILGHWKNKEDKAEPIRTTEGQPRLLIVAVDVQDATTVTFDSYPKEDGRLMSVYGDEDKVKHEIYYDKGIEMKHLLTTMSSHVRHKFPELNVKSKFCNDGTTVEDVRPFMDGFYLSNTPLREVLQAHRDYYDKVIKKGKDVPSLDIIIGDLYPTFQNGTPLDPDSINNRVQDVLFHDKSKYDEKSAILV